MSDRLAKVPLFGNVAKAVTVNLAATNGARIGTNLLMPDGSLATTAKLAALFGAGTPADSSINTTDDLDEGQWNLWFTDRRAQDAVGAILADSATVSLAYVSGASIAATLNDLTDTNTGTFKLITRDTKGRVSGSADGTTDDVPEGGDNLYFTDARAQAAVVVSGITDGDTDHSPSGDAVHDALAGKEPAITAGTTAQYWRGDKTWRDFATDVRGAVLTGLSLATSAVIAATDTVLQAFGKLQAQITDNLLPAGYIDGLQMQWVSGTALTVTSGSAYIEGSGKVLRAPAAIAKTGLSLTASTWYHVYLYDNAGTPAVEVVTTAPASPYNGTARSKAGDTSRRYVGSVLTDASSTIAKFLQSGDAVMYETSIALAPFLVVSTGRATSATNVACGGAVPVTGKIGLVIMATINATADAAIGNADMVGTLSSSNYLQYVGNGVQTTHSMPLDSSQRFSYVMTASTATGGFFARVCGYVMER